MTFLHDVRNFLRKVDDFGKLSGGQLRAKYGCEPVEGYEWIAKQGRELAAKIDKAERENGVPIAISGTMTSMTAVGPDC